MKNLQILDLSDNKIQELPLEFYQLKGLTTLNLSNNLLRQISTEIVKLTNLTNLNLSQNLLSNLPYCIHKLPLKVLNITQNLFFSYHSLPYYTLKDRGVIVQKNNRISLISPIPDILYFRLLLLGDSTSGNLFLYFFFIFHFNSIK